MRRSSNFLPGNIKNGLPIYTNCTGLGVFELEKDANGGPRAEEPAFDRQRKMVEWMDRTAIKTATDEALTERPL
jgi:hypothetical protein